ncbi:hypothetical protein HAX54_001401 [Datura stramonium]|uniref:Uncharacterized protein n=1 Tax=Datura stramonium TaxID=4076 RepID=A0ABS8WUF1_DATST|nr:hypothetical protein [Datura stramonium]
MVPGLDLRVLFVQGWWKEHWTRFLFCRASRCVSPIEVPTPCGGLILGFEWSQIFHCKQFPTNDNNSDLLLYRVEKSQIPRPKQLITSDPVNTQQCSPLPDPSTFSSSSLYSLRTHLLPR